MFREEELPYECADQRSGHHPYRSQEHAGEEAYDGAPGGFLVAAGFLGEPSRHDVVEDGDNGGNSEPDQQEGAGDRFAFTAVSRKENQQESHPTEGRPGQTGEDAADYAKKEADNDARPAIEPLEVDPASYKTVFIGYPVWWYKMPMVMETFFDTYDFSGVTIVPFNTHEGSGDGGTYTMIQEREPDATVLEGLAIRGGNAGEDSAKEEIIEWLGGLDLVS